MPTFVGMTWEIENTDFAHDVKHLTTRLTKKRLSLQSRLQSGQPYEKTGVGRMAAKKKSKKTAKAKSAKKPVKASKAKHKAKSAKKPVSKASASKRPAPK